MSSEIANEISTTNEKYETAEHNLNEKTLNSLDEEELRRFEKSYNYAKKLCKTREDLIDICTEVINIMDNNLLHNIDTSTSESVLVYIYKIKGDFLRYMWEANSDKKTYEEATKAYYEAMSKCQWNFEPTNVYLLQVALNYAVHLKNENIDQAVLILKTVINDALEEVKDQENNNLTDKPLVELLLEQLKGHLVQFRKIADDRNSVFQLIEPEVDGDSQEMIDFEEPTSFTSDDEFQENTESIETIDFEEPTRSTPDDELQENAV